MTVAQETASVRRLGEEDEYTPVFVLSALHHGEPQKVVLPVYRDGRVVRLIPAEMSRRSSY